MTYEKLCAGEYILALGQNIGGEPISGEEYARLLTLIIACSPTPEGFLCRLRTDETWETIPEDPTEGVDAS